MYFLLKMGIFQPAMLVFERVYLNFQCPKFCLDMISLPQLDSL